MSNKVWVIVYWNDEYGHTCLEGDVVYLNRDNASEELGRLNRGGYNQFYLEEMELV